MTNFLLKDIFIVTSHGNIFVTKEISHTHTISNNCMESSFFNIHILSERWGRTSSAPNSALRLLVDKDQGLLCGILSQAILLLPSMKLEQELKW